MADTFWNLALDQILYLNVILQIKSRKTQLEKIAEIEIKFI